jgi:DNA-binding LacI/PurR family transcriptional regulator
MTKRKGDPSPATITTVAAKAQVAPMTVSRVINGGYVSAEVRARVERVIKDVGYAPSSTARSLRYGRKGCVGVAVESIHDAWFMGLLGGIEEELGKSHVGLMLGSWKPGDNPYNSSTVSAWIDARRVDGFIMVRATKRELPLLRAAAAASVPVTLICPDQAADVAFTVRCRNFDAGKTIGAHLLAQGHRRLSFVGGPQESIDSLDRLRGLREVVAGVKGATLRAEDVLFQSSYMPRAGVLAAREYLKRPVAQRATAVVMGNDSMAIAFICEMMKAGLRVPADVSVTGFDGIDEGERCWPMLTTVAQPMHRLGAAACRGLLDRIDDPGLDPGITAEFPMLLVERESTAPPAASTLKVVKKPRSASLS